ncbi:unnamed protein product [Closterium sp. NIES-54]
MSLVAPSTAHGEGSREWLVRRARLWSGATGAGDAKTGGARVTAGAGGTGGSVAAGPRGARTRGVGAAGTGGVGAAGAGDPTEPGAAGDGGSCAGAGAAGAGAVDPGAEGAGGTVRPRPYFVPLLKQVLGVPSSTSLTTPLLCPPPDQLQPPLLSASPLPAPSSYAEQFGGLIEPREPASCPVSPVRTTRRVPRSRPPPVPGTHAMALHSSFSERARAASSTVSPLLATAVTDPSFESAAAFDLIAELLDFAAAFRLDYATALVAESASATPPSVGGECALGTDVLEDRHEDFECLGAASMLLPCCLPLRETRMHQTSRPRALSKRRLRRHTCTDLGELRSYLGLQITPDRARRTIILTQSHMVHHVLQRFGFQFSSPRPTPLSTSHSLSDSPSDESVEPSSPYPELVGYLMYLMTCTL